jgi:hypothetical protein
MENKEDGLLFELFTILYFVCCLIVSECVMVIYLCF